MSARRIYMSEPRYRIRKDYRPQWIELDRRGISRAREHYRTMRHAGLDVFTTRLIIADFLTAGAFGTRHFTDPINYTDGNDEGERA